MEFLLGFLTITLITILGVVSPGPDTALVIKNSLFKSRNDGVATAAGIALGNVFYVTLALFGLGAVIAQSLVLFSVIKYCGAVYLVYLGVRLLTAKSSTALPTEGHHATSSIPQSFREGFITNLSNPKFMVFLIALFTQVIEPTTPFVIQVVWAYQIPVIAVIWFSTLSFLFTTSAVRTRLAGIMHYLERAMGVILVGLGIKVALSVSR